MCKNCIHGKVCALKERYNSLKEQYNKELDENFSIEVNCKFYKKEIIFNKNENKHPKDSFGNDIPEVIFLNY